MGFTVILHVRAALEAAVCRQIVILRKTNKTKYTRNESNQTETGGGLARATVPTETIWILQKNRKRHKRKKRRNRFPKSHFRFHPFRLFSRHQRPPSESLRFKVESLTISANSICSRSARRWEANYICIYCSSGMVWRCVGAVEQTTNGSSLTFAQVQQTSGASKNNNNKCGTSRSETHSFSPIITINGGVAHE